MKKVLTRDEKIKKYGISLTTWTEPINREILGDGQLIDLQVFLDSIETILAEEYAKRDTCKLHLLRYDYGHIALILSGDRLGVMKTDKEIDIEIRLHETN